MHNAVRFMCIHMPMHMHVVSVGLTQARSSKNIKQDVGIAEQQIVGEQGREHNLRQFSVQPPTYLFSLYMYYGKRYVGGGVYTELFYAIIPTLFPYSLLFCYPYFSLHFCLGTGVPRHRDGVVRPYVHTYVRTYVNISVRHKALEVVARAAAKWKQRTQK